MKRISLSIPADAQKYAVLAVCALLALLDVPSAVAVGLAYVALVRLSDSLAGAGGNSAIPTAVLGAFAVLASALPAFMSHYRLMWQAFDAFGNVNGGEYLAIATVAWAILAGSVLLAVRWPWRDRWFVSAALLFFALIKLYYVISIDGTAVSDFRSMLSQADRWVNQGFPEKLPESVAGAVHAERILLYLYPIRLVFGTDANNFQYVNVAASCATALLSYGITRKVFGADAGAGVGVGVGVGAGAGAGAGAARVALVFALFAIEPMQASEIPTHDIPGALAIMAMLGAFVLLYENLDRRSAWVWSALLGMSLVWVAMQRSIGLVVILALAVFVLLLIAERLMSKGRLDFAYFGRPALFILILPCIIYLALSTVLVSAELKRPSEGTSGWRAIIVSAHSESWGHGSYGYWKKYWLPRDLPDGEELRFVGKRLLSDYYYSPGENLAHYFRKAWRLHGFGALQGFYLNQAILRGEEKLDRTWKTKFRHLNTIFAGPLLLLYALGVLLFFSRVRRLGAAHFPVLVLGVFTGILILFTEVQSRYLFPIWYIAPIYIGYFIAECTRGKIGRVSGLDA